jgi:DNA-binding beta-propeller fold protein YncE
MVVRRRAAALALALLAGGWSPRLALATEASQPLVLEATIPLDGVSGRIDHMAIDLARRHLLVGELGNDTVDVVDLAARRVVHRITGLKEPQGVAVAPSADLVVVANAGDGSVAFFRAADFSPVGKTDLGDDADNIRIDGRTGHVLVGYGRGGLAVIDPATRSKLANIRLAGHPEGFRLTRDGGRAFVNVPDARRIAVVDMTAGRQVTTWSVPNLRSNFPMAIDGSEAKLAIVFRSPARLVLLDTANGAVRADLDACNDADDVFFDDRRRRVYVSCGEGAVDVFGSSNDQMRRIARIETALGARTALFVPELDRLFIASRAGLLGGEAKILVFRPAP